MIKYNDAIYSDRETMYDVLSGKKEVVDAGFKVGGIPVFTVKEPCTASALIIELQNKERMDRIAKMSLGERAALVYEILEMDPLKLTKEDYASIVRASNDLP